MFFSPFCPAGGNIATISDPAAEGQGVSTQTEHGVECPVRSRGGPSGEAAGSNGRYKELL